MMRRFLNRFILACAGLLVACASLRADTASTAPDFQQVYDLLRANLTGISASELNSAAVEGLLKQLHGRATIAGSSTDASASANGADLVKSSLLESDVAYLRVGTVGSRLKGELDAAYRRLAATNNIVGVALDLRFADGNDYAGAVAVAGLFSKGRPSLRLDDTVKTASPARQPIPGPVLVLVNGGTSGAAEALAAELRAEGVGLIIGNPTAGLVMTMRDFPLKNGETLRIATNPVKLDNGDTISRISPDITVPVSQEDEQTYLKDPYAMLGGNENSRVFGTNDISAFVDHTSEADLVRQKLKDGEEGGVIAPVPAHRQSPPRPVIQDPVLARALDLIKGLAIVHESRL